MGKQKGRIDMETGEKSNSSRNSKHSFRGLDRDREEKASKTRGELNGKKIRFSKDAIRNQGEQTPALNKMKDTIGETDFFCTHCGQSLSAEKDMARMEIEYPACEKTITVPGEQKEPAIEEKNCPYCDETIRESAIRCKHCGSDLETVKMLSCNRCGHKFQISESEYEEARFAHHPLACTNCNSKVLVMGSAPTSFRYRNAKRRSQNSNNKTQKEEGCLMTAGWFFALLGG